MEGRKAGARDRQREMFWEREKVLVHCSDFLRIGSLRKCRPWPVGTWEDVDGGPGGEARERLPGAVLGRKLLAHKIAPPHRTPHTGGQALTWLGSWLQSAHL